MKTLDRIVGWTAKLLNYGAAVAVLGVAFLGANNVLNLSIEQAPMIGLLSLAYLLFYGIGAIIVSGATDRQKSTLAYVEARDVARRQAADPVTGEPSVFTPEQWAAISTMPSGRALADPATRWQFEAALRADPVRLQEMQRNVAQIQSEQDAALSPMAKQWIWRLVIAAIVGGIALYLNQK